MRIVICGSRTFTDSQRFKEELDTFLRVIESGIEDEIILVSGGARGADTMARNYAKASNYMFEEYLAEWDLHGKKAGILRNITMLEIADVVMAFWDQNSRGTKHMIEECKKRNIPLMLVTV